MLSLYKIAAELCATFFTLSEMTLNQNKFLIRFYLNSTIRDDESLRDRFSALHHHFKGRNLIV